MRLIILILFLFAFNASHAKALPDTVTFWQVYLDGYLIKSFNENERNPTLTIDLEKITKGNKLLIKYFRDTPCSSCPTHLVIYDDAKNEILSVTGKGTFSSLSFSINRLTDKWSTQTIKYFEAYYFENNSPHHKLLFTLKFQ